MLDVLFTYEGPTVAKRIPLDVLELKDVRAQHRQQLPAKGDAALLPDLYDTKPFEGRVAWAGTGLRGRIGSSWHWRNDKPDVAGART